MIALVVNNAQRPAEPDRVTDADLRALAQTALVKAAKNAPLRVIVFADLGDDTTAVWTSGLSRPDAVRLAGVGVNTILEQL